MHCDLLCPFHYSGNSFALLFCLYYLVLLYYLAAVYGTILLPSHQTRSIYE